MGGIQYLLYAILYCVTDFFSFFFFFFLASLVLYVLRTPVLTNILTARTCIAVQ